MVEAAKAHNPFATGAATTNKLDITNCCPNMARLGICLEPQMCFLIHIIPTEDAPAQMTAQAKAFNPFAAGTQATSVSAKEFKPPSSG